MCGFIIRSDDIFVLSNVRRPDNVIINQVFLPQDCLIWSGFNRSSLLVVLVYSLSSLFNFLSLFRWILIWSLVQLETVLFGVQVLCLSVISCCEIISQVSPLIVKWIICRQFVFVFLFSLLGLAEQDGWYQWWFWTNISCCVYMLSLSIMVVTFALFLHYDASILAFHHFFIEW